MIGGEHRCAIVARRRSQVEGRRGAAVLCRCLTLTALVLAAACSRSERGSGSGNGAAGGGLSAIPAGWPEGAPYITGIVTQFDRDTIRIEERPQMKGGSPKAVLTIERTTMLRGIGGSEDPRLRVGQRVSAWVGPRVRESYPVRAQALALQIVEDSTPFTKP